MPNSLRCTLLLVAVIAGCAAEGTKTPTDGESNQATAVDPNAEGTGDAARPIALFFGDSITAGYGLDARDAFPALVQRKADSADFSIEIVAAGSSGETSAGGLRRIQWMLDRPLDVFLLELGANDGLRGVPIADIRRNLQAILDSVSTRHPDARLIVAGMRIPPNMGRTYTESFHALFQELAEANDAELIPFLLDGVAGDPDLNLPDRIHPNKRGHEILARTVWETLRKDN